MIRRLAVKRWQQQQTVLKPMIHDSYMLETTPQKFAIKLEPASCVELTTILSKSPTHACPVLLHSPWKLGMPYPVQNSKPM
jgi:hypothetical protein